MIWQFLKWYIKKEGKAPFMLLFLIAGILGVFGHLYTQGDFRELDFTAMLFFIGGSLGMWREWVTFKKKDKKKKK